MKQYYSVLIFTIAYHLAVSAGPSYCATRVTYLSKPDAEVNRLANWTVVRLNFSSAARPLTFSDITSISDIVVSHSVDTAAFNYTLTMSIPNKRIVLQRPSVSISTIIQSIQTDFFLLFLIDNYSFIYILNRLVYVK